MARTREELMKMGEMDPEFEKAVKERPLALGGSDILEMRASRAAHLQSLHKHTPIPGPLPDVIERDQFISTRDGTTIRVRIYSPKDIPKGGSPLIVMYHEGGWCFGDLSDEELNSPEHPFPTGVNDAWDALRWVAANASALSADPTLGFIVGGTSAGGNITAVITHLARDCNLQPPLTGQYLSVPALLPADVVPEKYRPEYLSLTSNVSDPVLGGMDTGTIYKAYKPDSSSPLFAPFNHPAGHTGVPRAYFQVCGMDPLRDHALICERVLREEYGIDTKLDLYPGFGHTFWTNWPEMEMSRKFVNDTLEGMKWLLSAGKVGVVSQEGEPI